MADGRLVKCPEANISVRTPYFCGKAKALCLINPLYDLLVGNIPGASNSDTPFIGGDYLNINSATVMDIPKDKVLSHDTDMSIDIGCNITPSVEKGEVVLPLTDVEVESDEELTNFDSCNVITRGMANRDKSSMKPLKVGEVSLTTDKDMSVEQLADPTLEKFWTLAKPKEPPAKIKGSTIGYKIKKNILYRTYQNK
jgi:hypothetical protein